MKTIRFGIIGCGGIARKRFIPGILNAKLSVCEAIMDTNKEFLNAVGEEFGIAKRYTDIDSLLSDRDIDAVYIATPLFCHKEQALKAADAGKHILLEKPMALTSKDAHEIKEYCKKKGVRLSIGFMMRGHGAHRAIKDLIDRGELGEIVSAYAKFNCLSRVNEHKWRQTKAYGGGGAMMDMGIHCIDLLSHITSLSVSEVSAMYSSQIYVYPDTEDSATGVFKMNNGAIFTVEANFNIPDTLGGCKFEIYGTRGSLIANRTIGQVEEGTVSYITEDFADEGYRTLPYESGNMYTKEADGFAEAIINGTEVPVPASEAILNQRIVEAIYESYETKKHIIF